MIKTYNYTGKIGKFYIEGDDGDYGNWVYRIFPLNDFTKESLENALDELILCTKNMREFLTYKETPESENSYEVTMYLIRFKYKNTLIEEKLFFEKCVEFLELHQKILIYVNNVTSLEMDEETTWQNEMHHRGIYAITPLLFNDKKYANDFGKLLYAWDMSSELFQSSIIRYSFFKHGIKDEMLNLLVWRIISDGQSITEDINAIFLNKTIKESFNIDDFFQKLQKIEQIIPLDNIQMNMTDFILGYSYNIQECNTLALQVKSFLGEKFNIEECIDNCSESYNKHYFNITKIKDYTADFEKEWDTEPIENLVIGNYLKDKNRILNSY